MNHERHSSLVRMAEAYPILARTWWHSFANVCSQGVAEGIGRAAPVKSGIDDPKRTSLPPSIPLVPSPIASYFWHAWCLYREAARKGACRTPGRQRQSWCHRRATDSHIMDRALASHAVAT